MVNNNDPAMGIQLPTLKQFRWQIFMHLIVDFFIFTRVLDRRVKTIIGENNPVDLDNCN